MCPEAFCGDGSDEKRTSRDRNGRRSGGLGERICRALEERQTTPASGGSGVGREAHGDLQGEPENLRNPTATDRFGAAGNSVRQAAHRALAAPLWTASGAEKRRFRPCTTQSDPSLPVAKNDLAKVPAPDRPNQIWVADITSIETQEGWLYLAGILDLYSRKVAGWNTSDSLATELVTRAWKQAWKKHRPDPGLLHHSDRGCQYASKEFRSLLAEHQAGASMSRKGNCYDNAAMESFWATLKTECFGSFIPETKE